MFQEHPGIYGRAGGLASCEGMVLCAGYVIPESYTTLNP